MTNQTKNSPTWVGQDKKPDFTWDDADFTWDDAGPDTWDNQTLHFHKQTKNTTTFTGQTKN